MEFFGTVLKNRITLKFIIMKKISRVRRVIFVMLLSGLFLPRMVKAQDGSQQKTITESREAKAAFLKTDASMGNLFKNSYGYAILPNVGKGAVGVGGAAGKGAVYEKGKVVGTAQMVQVTVGAQAGGQAYREVVFFENKDAFDRFRDDKIEFSGQASAIAVKSGAAANANYRNGVVVFSQEKGGLMLEASLGGQKFNFKSLK
jgi:lipid-binding SYLF domain-containing protein